MAKQTDSTVRARVRGDAKSVLHSAGVETLDQPLPACPGGRFLVLKGAWSLQVAGFPSDAFALDATLAVSGDGATSGSIWWRSIDRSSPVVGFEQVRGQVGPALVEREGVKAGPGLACDRYRITLTGDERRGSFRGSSWAFGDWQGRMQGSYEYWNQGSA